jgi:hypothetical protein
MTAIPPGFPPEEAQGSVQSHRKASPTPLESQAVRVMGEGAESGSRAHSLTQHSLKVLTSSANLVAPKDALPFYQGLGIDEGLCQRLFLVDARQLSDFHFSVMHIDALGSDAPAQHSALTDFESGIRGNQDLAPQVQDVFARILNSVTLVTKLSSGDLDLYCNRQGITVAGLTNPTPMQAQQAAQKALSQGIVPQKIAQQFSQQIPKAQAITAQQLQASQQKGKAVASQCLTTLAQIAQDVALEKTEEKKRPDETKKPEAKGPSAQSAPQQTPSQAKEIRVLREAESIFQSIAGKAPEETEHQKALQKQMQARHKAVIEERITDKKEEGQKILKEEIHTEEIKEEETK